MLKFTKYTEDREFPEICIDPLEVSHVEETQRRPLYGFWQKVARVSMKNGEELLLRDENRSTLRTIAEAQKENQ